MKSDSRVYMSVEEKQTLLDERKEANQKLLEIAAQKEVVDKESFNPSYEEFKPKTLWSLENSFTHGFKQLNPIPQYQATARLGTFMKNVTPANYRRWSESNPRNPATNPANGPKPNDADQDFQSRV